MNFHIGKNMKSKMLVGTAVISYLFGVATCFVFCRAYIGKYVRRADLLMKSTYAEFLSDNAPLHDFIKDVSNM